MAAAAAGVQIYRRAHWSGRLRAPQHKNWNLQTFGAFQNFSKDAIPFIWQRISRAINLDEEHDTASSALSSLWCGAMHAVTLRLIKVGNEQNHKP